MKDEFTMAEYIQRHKIPIGLKDSGATRIIAEHLKSKGYIRVRKRVGGRPRWVWTRESRPSLDLLKRQLEKL